VFQENGQGRVGVSFEPTAAGGAQVRAVL